MSWRPDGWKNPYEWAKNPQFEKKQKKAAYEDGADAMVEARDSFWKSKIDELYDKAGDDTAFRCMLFSYLYPEPEEQP